MAGPVLGSTRTYCRDPFMACFGGHDEASLLAFEALRGSPRPARGQALDAKRTVEVPLCGHVSCQFFEPHFRGHDEAVFGCKKSIHYQISQHEQLDFHQNKSTFKRYTKKPSLIKPTPFYTIELGKNKCEKRSNTENWLYSLGTRF